MCQLGWFSLAWSQIAVLAISNRILCFLVATSISFDQPTYNVDENNKGIQTMLVLSKPQYTDIIVEVIDFGITATSKYFTYGTIQR